MPEYVNQLSTMLATGEEESPEIDEYGDLVIPEPDFDERI